MQAAHIMVAAEAVRKLAAEAAPQPERKALQDLNADQYERQLLTEVRMAGLVLWGTSDPPAACCAAFATLSLPKVSEFAC